MRLDAKLRNQFTNFGTYPRDAHGTPRRHWLRVLLISLLLIGLLSGASFAVKQHYANKKAEQQRLEKSQSEETTEQAEKTPETEAGTEDAAEPAAP